MNRSFARLLAVLSLASALSLTVAKTAQAAPTEGWVSTTVEGGVANLRAAPSTSSAVQVTAANGTQFSISSQVTDAAGYVWYQVRPESSVMPASNVWLRSDLVSLAPPIAAQPQISCDSAIAQTETKLRSVYNTQISDRTLNDHNYSGNVPVNRPESFRFSLSNEGANSVLASPVLMNTLSAQLIENCPNIALVTFAADTSTRGYAAYGYMPGRMVRPFSCNFGGNAANLTWGERACS